MFADQVKISVEAGRGGHGIVSFRREKYVARGGPDGGSGGRGGSIYFVATHNISTLTDFRHGIKIKANNGGNGAGKNSYGKSGSDLYVNVPVGTVVTLATTGEVIADFKDLGETILIAKGGRGGRGNTAFKSSLNRVPRMSENGLMGDTYDLILELKLLADIGFIGFPNAGKSTLLSVISDARPQIADYPFTTLNPELGVVSYHGETFVASDLPGIIEGAHLGKGLGFRFLRHAERCRVLLFIIDGESSNAYYDDYLGLREEILKYGYGLENRPFIVSVSKDENAETKKKIKAFKKKLKDVEIVSFSSLLSQGIEELKGLMLEEIRNAPTINLVREDGNALPYRTYDLTKDTSANFTVTKEGRGRYKISGEEVETRYHKYALNSDEAVLSLLNYLREIGVEEALMKAGVEDGATVSIVDFEFEYFT